MKKTGLLISCLFISVFVLAQKPAFWDDIQRFKKADSISKPPAGQILFVGSSSFTFWKDVQDYFPGYPILNRGFGGSTLTDLIRYKEEVIIPYKPRQIFMYCGENDFAASDTLSVETVVNRFKTLFGYIQSKYKNIPFGYVSMKPSPSRKHLMPKFNDANKQIAAYLRNFKNTVFIDAYNNMLLPDGNPMPDIFKEDQLHMNAKGYAIWQKLIAPYLKK